jgi:hypothetical protein
VQQGALISRRDRRLLVLQRNPARCHLP